MDSVESILKGKREDDKGYHIPGMSSGPRTTTQTRMCRPTSSLISEIDVTKEKRLWEEACNNNLISTHGEIYDALWLKLAEERIERCTEEFNSSKKRKIELLTPTTTHDYAKENLARLMQSSPTDQISTEKKMSINYVLDDTNE
jgi:hypothetical protein